MGFLDKAKKLADQAQAKVDEVQKDFTARQSGGSGTPASGGPAVEYDQHGRPVTPPPAEPAVTPVPTPGVPATAASPGVPDAPPDKSPRLDHSEGTSPNPEASEPAKRHGDPLLNDEPGSRQGQPPPAPPSGGQGLSSGDPLAG